MSSPESNHEQTDSPADATTKPLRGDEAQLFARYGDRLQNRVAAQVCAPRATIEDACSFAWLQLLRHPPEERVRVIAWLTTVAVREVWHLSQQERRAELTSDSFEEIAGNRLQPEHRVEFLEEITALAGLRPDERELIVLQAIGWSLDEIADTTGVSWRAVCRRLRRARLHLAESTRAP